MHILDLVEKTHVLTENVMKAYGSLAISKRGENSERGLHTLTNIPAYTAFPMSHVRRRNDTTKDLLGDSYAHDPRLATN